MLPLEVCYATLIKTDIHLIAFNRVAIREIGLTALKLMTSSKTHEPELRMITRGVSFFTTGGSSWNLGTHEFWKSKGGQKNFWYLKGGAEKFYRFY